MPHSKASLKLDAKPKKKPVRSEFLAGLHIPLHRLHQRIKARSGSTRVNKFAVVTIGAHLEEKCAQLIVQSAHQAGKFKTFNISDAAVLRAVQVNPKLSAIAQLTRLPAPVGGTVTNKAAPSKRKKENESESDDAV